MRTTLRIQARISQSQPLHRTSIYQVFANDLLHVLHMNEPIPHCIGIHHDHRPMLTLVEASQLIGAHLPLQTSIVHRIFER